MNEKKVDPLFNKTLKIFLFVILPAVFIYVVLTSNITGFAIDNSKGSETQVAMGIVGAFLGTIVLFFLVLLVLIKIRGKPYKVPNSKN